MKKVYSFLFAIIVTISVLAQTPQKMTYQAVIRNGNNQLVTTHAIRMRISIIQGAANGTTVYTETQTPTTNANGLVNVEIGGGTGFNAINWGSGDFFIKTETDPTGGTNYTIIGTSQLLSVPYAFHAKTAENGFSGNYNDLINKPYNPVLVIPRIATKGQKLSVSFSGGDDITFTQASSTCTNLYPSAILTFAQGTPTTIYPVSTYFIDSKRFDAVFDIPSAAPSGLYNIILSPSSSCPYTINSFKIY